MFSNRLNGNLYGIVIVSILWFGFSSGYLIDLTIDGPSTAIVGETFIISGTSHQSAAERVDLYHLKSREPVASAVIGIEPPFDYEFEISVSDDSLNVGDVTIYSGPTKGKVFHFFTRTPNTPFNESPILSVSID